MKRIIFLLFFIVGVCLSSPAEAYQKHHLKGEIDFERGAIDILWTLGKNSKIINRINPNGIEESPSINRQVIFEFFLTENSAVQLKSQKLERDEFQVVLIFTHIQTPKFIISSQIKSTVKRHEQKSGKAPYYKGKIESKYTLVDFKPSREIRGNFYIKDEMFLIKNFLIGPVTLDGFLNLKPPYKIDINLATRFLDIDSFLFFWLKKKKSKFGGYASGKVNIAGENGKFLVGADLDCRDVTYNESTFDRIKINLEGYYPYVQIQDTLVDSSDGIKFALNGPFDLSDQVNYLAQVKELKIRTIFNETDDKIEWTLKSLKGEQPGKTEIIYLKRKSGRLGNLQKDEGDIIGIERRLEF